MMRELLRAINAMASERSSDPLAYFDPLPHQLEYLTAAGQHRKRILRCGNQLGKSTVGCLEDLMYALGRHPYDPMQPLARQWVIGSTRQQSLSCQQATWSLVPKHLVAPGQRWDPAEGFGRNNPHLRLRVPGTDKLSIINYVSDRQGTLALAGATVDRVRFDEPIRPETFGEAAARVRQGANRLSFTLTPVGRDCTWIRDMVERGELHETHTRLTPEALIHTRSGLPKRTREGEVCDEAWVNRTITDCLPYEVPVRCHGDWDFATEGAYFAGFKAADVSIGGHLIDQPTGDDLALYLGFDHGTGIGNQTACLIGFAKDGTLWVLAEWSRAQLSTVEADARDVITMLNTLGVTWSDLQQAYGDIPAGQGVARRGNIDLEDGLRKVLKLRTRKALQPRIRTTASKRGKGANPRQAAQYAYRWLHRLMAEGKFRVLKSCEGLIEALGRWDGTPAHQSKHLVDALHYAASGVIAAQRRNSGGRARVLRVR